MKNNTISQSMIEGAKKAGSILKKAFDKNILTEINKGKNYYDVTSKADTDSEDVIIKIITKRHPNVNILSEESGFIDRGSLDTIVIDPLDGSSNFLLGIPHFSISIAHFNKGLITSSVVYNPILKKLYFAEKGKGAFLNDKKLFIKTRKGSSCISVNFSHKEKWEGKKIFYDKAYKFKIGRIMNNWSPNLDFCLLAENKIDAVVSNDSLIFDFAPGFLIAKESGCLEFPRLRKVDTTMKSSASFVIAKNKALSKKLYLTI